jgi:hypothetical protein
MKYRRLLMMGLLERSLPAWKSLCSKFGAAVKQGLVIPNGNAGQTTVATQVGEETPDVARDPSWTRARSTSWNLPAGLKLGDEACRGEGWPQWASKSDVGILYTSDSLAAGKFRKTLIAWGTKIMARFMLK